MDTHLSKLVYVNTRVGRCIPQYHTPLGRFPWSISPQLRTMAYCSKFAYLSKVSIGIDMQYPSLLAYQ